MNNIPKVYKRNMNVSSSQRADESSASSNKDVVEISREGLRQSEFGKTVRSVSANIYEDTPPEKLEELRQAVQSGTYSVPGKRVATAILSRIITW